MTLRLKTLGHPSVFLAEEELSSLPGKPVTFGLLVFLATEGEATRDRLVSVFWPESSQEKARHALSQTLYELRQALGEGWIESAGNIVRLAESAQVDSRQFLEHSEAGRHADAVALFDGPFLDGVHLAQTHPFEEWVERFRARLSRRHRASVDAFIKDCRAEGDLSNALVHAWKWVGMDPLDDGGQQHLIQLLAETGSRTEALAQYDRYVALLESELGLEPLEETVELVEAIRSGSAQSPRPPDKTGEGALEESTIEASNGPPPSRASAWPPPAPLEPETEHSEGPATDRDQLQARMEADLTPSLEVLRPIGQGSMAEVFLAREPHLKRLVAVKVLSPHLYSDQKARKRFEREAQAAARINHPHVCTVYRVGSLKDGTPFLVSPFVKGSTLDQRLRAEGRLGAPEVRRVIREVASALAAAHRMGIIHRDVRPDNVLRADDSGRHSLCDFGIAGVLETGEEHEPKLTQSGEILGHPAYISPEQMEGEPLTDRADIYSLGILAHQLLTGHPPPPADDDARSRGKGGTSVRLEPLEEFLGDSDPELVELIGHCLATDQAHRPSAADVERRLLGDRRSPVQEKIDELVEVNLFKLIFKKRLPQLIGAYAAGSWAVVEASSYVTDEFSLPQRIPEVLLLSVPFGFLAVSILGWFHGEKGPQEMPTVERLMLVTLALGWLVAILWLSTRS
jgi:serine/threonine protein kinase/DNA-binding SARP family transcriptional activator